jgi:YVTN family beta-propeller protein
MKQQRLVQTLLFCAMAAVLSAEPGTGQQKLFVLCSLTDQMAVVDVATNKVIKMIKVGALPHGIATPKSQDVLYVSIEGDQKTEGSSGLTVVNPIKDEVIKEYHVLGLRPNEIDVTSDGRFVYVPARGPGVYEVFDTVKEEIIARIPVDGFAHNVLVSPDDRYMYLSAYDRGSRSAEEVAAAGQPTTFNKKIYVVDTSTHSVVATIPTGEAPRPIAISPDGQRLYVNTDNLMGFLVLDLPGRKVLHRVTYDLTPEELAIRSRSHGIGVTPDQKEVWSTDVNHGLIHVFDITQDPPRQIARVKTGSSPSWVTFTPDGKTIYVSNAGDDTVSVIDVASKKERARIQLKKGTAPKRMLVLTVPG